MEDDKKSKYHKINEEEEVIIVTGSCKVENDLVFSSQEIKEDLSDRSNRYRLFLENQEPLVNKSFSKPDVENFSKKTREDWDDELEIKLRAEQDRFIELLFKKRP